MCVLCEARRARANRPLGPGLGDEWDTYVATFKAGTSPEVLVEARRAFYSGAAVFIAMCMEASVRNDRPSIARLVEETKEVLGLMRRGVV